MLLQSPSQVRDLGVSAVCTLRGLGRLPCPRRLTDVCSGCLASSCSWRLLQCRSGVGAGLRPSLGTVTAWPGVCTLRAALTRQHPATSAPSRLWAPMSAGRKDTGVGVRVALHWPAGAPWWEQPGCHELGSRRQIGSWAEAGRSTVSPHLQVGEGLKAGDRVAHPVGP